MNPVAGDALASFLGLRWEGSATVRLDVRPGHLNSAGLLLGPVSFALMDYAMTSCLWEHLAEDEAAATINIAINYLRSAERGTITCRAELQRRNRRNGILAASIHDDDARLLSTAIGTFAIFPAATLKRALE